MFRLYDCRYFLIFEKMVELKLQFSPLGTEQRGIVNLSLQLL